MPACVFRARAMLASIGDVALTQISRSSESLTSCREIIESLHEKSNGD